MPPMILAICSFPCCEQHLLEVFYAHAGLLGAHVLDAESENAGELGEVIDVAARGYQVEDVALAYRFALLVVQAVLPAVGIFIGQELLAIAGVVE